jgi:hypothetical protein
VKRNSGQWGRLDIFHWHVACLRIDTLHSVNQGTNLVVTNIRFLLRLRFHTACLHMLVLSMDWGENQVSFLVTVVESTG